MTPTPRNQPTLTSFARLGLRAAALAGCSILLSGCYLMALFQANEHSKKIAAMKPSEKIEVELPPIYEPLRTPQEISVRFEGDNEDIVFQSLTDQVAGFHQVARGDQGPIVLEASLRYSYDPVAAKVTDGSTVEACIATMTLTGTRDGEPILNAEPQATGSYDVARGASPQGEEPTCRLAAKYIGGELGSHIAPYRSQTALITHDLENKEANTKTARARELFGQKELADAEKLLREVIDMELNQKDAGWALHNLGRYMQAMRLYRECGETLQKSADTLPAKTSKEFGVAKSAQDCQKFAQIWFR